MLNQVRTINLETCLLKEISCLTQKPINANLKQNNKGIVTKITRLGELKLN